MEIDHKAPATAEGEIHIAAPPAAVWDVISTLDAWPAWSPDIKSVNVDGPVVSGTVFRWKSGSSSLTSVLQVVDPPRELAWTGKTMGITAVHVFRFEPDGPGTRVRSEESWKGAIRRWLALLKAEVERRAPA
jgi:uncharacterized protein YndB with AHSA1/START domain